MKKHRIKIGDHYYRVREGVLIRIPEKWLGKVTHPQTIRKRQSKFTKKVKRYMQAMKKGHKINYKELKYGIFEDFKSL